MPTSDAPLTLCVVSDGRRGIENQALGLAGRVVRHLHERGFHTVTERRVATQPALRDVISWQFGIPRDAATTQSIIARHLDQPVDGVDLWIGCGRASVDLTRMARHLASHPLTVQIQHPRRRARDYDLIFPPLHDHMRPSVNVIPLLGSPNRISGDFLKTADMAQPPAASSPRPIIGFCIGGNSKTHRFADADMMRLCEDVERLLARDFDVWITTSRRTPEPLTAKLNELHSLAAGRVWLWTGEADGPNPYARFLRDADCLVVTSDSTNMLTEAASAGKPVFIWPMRGRDGKFRHLYASLVASGHARWFDAALDHDTFPAIAEPLDETGRAAGIVVQQLLALKGIR